MRFDRVRLLCLLLTSGTAILSAQATPRAEFDVVSIHPSKPGTISGIRSATAPDGYTVTAQSMRATMLLAYFPQGSGYWSRDLIVGAPAWLDDAYDIAAKVAPADLAEWQKQGFTLMQKPLLREMLQAMLADRCKLVLHRTPSTVAGYALVVSKRGSKLTESRPNEPTPDGAFKQPDGSAMVPYRPDGPPQLSFTSTSMAAVARQLSLMASSPVLDQTGLTGRYNFVLKRPIDLSEAETRPSDWNVQEFGLELKAIKIPIDAITIDHIEKPSEN